MDSRPKGIDIETLTVGEFNAMQSATTVWAMLYNINEKYLRAFIARMENDKSEMAINTGMSLPVFKIILFCCEHLKDHIKNDPKLKNAIEDAVARRKAMEMLNIEEIPDPDGP